MLKFGLLAASVIAALAAAGSVIALLVRKLERTCPVLPGQPRLGRRRT